jgi:hypothetical protein
MARSLLDRKDLLLSAPDQERQIGGRWIFVAGLIKAVSAALTPDVVKWDKHQFCFCRGLSWLAEYEKTYAIGRQAIIRRNRYRFP